jgi:hypothetical protein
MPGFMEALFISKKNKLFENAMAVKFDYVDVYYLPS